MAFTPIPEGTLNWDDPLNAALTDQDQRITENTGNIGAATSAANDALNQVAALGGDVTDLTSDVGILQGDVSSAQSDIISLQARTDGQNYYYLVAASSAPTEVKNKADWVATGTNDQWPIQDALDAAEALGGGIVQLSSGVFLTSAPITIPPCVTLRGVHGNQIFNPDQLEPLAYIAPQADFVGGAAIVMLGQTAGGYADKSAEQQIQDLTIVGTDSAAGVHGIQASDYIHGVKLINVCINRVTGKGIYTFTENGAQPFSWTMNKVVVDNAGGVGYHLINHTDLTMIDSIAIGCQSDGYVLSNMPNSRLIGCRAEWNFGHGYKVEGDWGDGQGSGGMQVTGCSTDRNMLNGFDITSTGNGPILLTGVTTRRDGANWNAGGGGYAGIFCAGAETPVVISGWNNYPGQNDDGTGAPSPENGLVVNNNESVTVSGSYIHAITASVNDLNNNTVFLVDTATVYATGPSDTPAKVIPNRAELNSFNAGDHGLLCWSADPGQIGSTGYNLVSGTIYLTKVKVTGGEAVVSNIHYNIYNTPTGMTAGQCFVGLYDSTGARLAVSADQSTAMGSGGPKVAAITPVTIPPGYYYVAFLSNSTGTVPTVSAGQGGASVLNANLAAGTQRALNTGTGNTSLPASLTLTSLSANIAARWAALS
jgi:hypothetical protein